MLKKEKLNVSDNCKTALMVVMLTREEGTTIKQIAEALDWKENSVRGALSSIVKKKMGLTITSEIKDGERHYHVTIPKDFV